MPGCKAGHSCPRTQCYGLSPAEPRAGGWSLLSKPIILLRDCLLDMQSRHPRAASERLLNGPARSQAREYPDRRLLAPIPESALHCRIGIPDRAADEAPTPALRLALPLQRSRPGPLPYGRGSEGGWAAPSEPRPSGSGPTAHAKMKHVFWDRGGCYAGRDCQV
jgi:hypothetical protein